MMMKTTVPALLFAATATLAQVAPPDPTQPSSRMKAALLASSAIPELQVKALVMVNGPESISVMLEAVGGVRVLARPGVPFSLLVHDEARRLVIKRITDQGIEIEAPDHGETAIIPAFFLVNAVQTAPKPGVVEYLEFRDLPLMDALRMLSHQTGNNYSASVEANKMPINAMLRRVPADSVVDEICKSHGLWFKRDVTSGITRIMTVPEFEKDLVGYREETTEVFTLRYPNVHEIAYAIADLFGDRVQLSLGAEEQDEEARRDLEQRFDRFDVLNQRTQSAGQSTGTIIGGNVNGFLSSGGGSAVSGFGGFNNSSSSSGRYGDSTSRNRNRSDQRVVGADGLPIVQAEEYGFRNLTPDQAQRVQEALNGTSTTRGSAEVEGLRKRPATIFVTASRRNNMIVVRSADSVAMQDISTLVKRMDVQTPLVLLEVRVLSIELGDEFRSAFDYQFSDGNVFASFSRQEIGTPTDGGVLPTAAFNSSDMTFVIANQNFRARMQLFEQMNRVKTVATPTLLTANNEISRLFLGEERPLVRSINSQTIITDNNVATTPNTTTEFRNVGNTLLITPNINSDRTVTLRLVQENSSINADGASIPVVTNTIGGGTTVDEVDVDVVATRSISGTFVAKDNMTVAAGGLIEDVKSDKRGQVPFIGRVPVLGFFFRRQEKIDARRELVITIRPHILSTPEDGQRISEALLKNLAPASYTRLVEDGYLPLPAGGMQPPAMLVPPLDPTESEKNPR